MSLYDTTSQLTYDCNTGVVRSERDVDNNVTTTTEYDGLGRPTLRTEAGVRTSKNAYYDSAYLTVATQDLEALNDDSLVTVTHSDDLGRPYLTRSTPDNGPKPSASDGNPENVGVVVKRLAIAGCRTPPIPPAPPDPPSDPGDPSACAPDPNHYEAVSNPFISGQPPGNHGWTRTRTDALGRTVDVTTFSAPDLTALPSPWGTGANFSQTGSTEYTYDGDLTTIRDPAGKYRRTRIDALGRTVEVWEDPFGVNYSTTYAYDALDNLLTVSQTGSQGSRPRNFTYSSLSRLLTATNPESGLVTYTYDLNGNLLTKVDAVPVTTTMTYDSLNRVTGKTYTGPGSAPAVTYSYDSCTYGRGLLCSASNSVSTSSQTYDVLGRAATSTQNTGTIYAFSYQYNVAGGLKSIQYPSTMKVSYSYNQAGKLATARKGEAASSDLIASNANYWANGAPASLQLGNGVVEETAINSLQQISSITAKHSGTILWKSDLAYPIPNNGNISGQTISGNHAGTAFSYSQTYDYDSLNRLKSVLDSGVGAPVDAKTQVFVYDRFGNRALKQNSFKLGGAVEVTTDTPAAVETVFPDNKLNNCCTNNPVGNVTSLNGQTITYDAEHRVTQVQYPNAQSQTVLLKYFYDGEGRRIRSEKTTNGEALSVTVFVYDVNGQLSAEYTTPTTTETGRQYLTQDHLGSTRLITKSTGTPTDIVTSRHDFLPFGEEITRNTAAYGASALSMKFTGKERDAGSGLDYFGARYLSAAQGRFISPDPSNLSIDIKVPQSWNHYSYVVNNPLSYKDSNGFWPTWIHNQIINEAFPGLSAKQLQTLRTASYDTDYNNSVDGVGPQDPAASYVHSMANGNDSDPWRAAGNAVVDSRQVIERNERAARLAQAEWLAVGHTGIAPNALTAFGNALHTVTDGISPAHWPFKPWSGALLPGFAHLAREFRFSLRGEEKRQAIEAVRIHFLGTFGDQFYSQAIAERQRKPKVTSRLKFEDPKEEQ